MYRVDGERIRDIGTYAHSYTALRRPHTPVCLKPQAIPIALEFHSCMGSRPQPATWLQFIQTSDRDFVQVPNRHSIAIQLLAVSEREAST